MERSREVHIKFNGIVFFFMKYHYAFVKTVIRVHFINQVLQFLEHNTLGKLKKDFI